MQKADLVQGQHAVVWEAPAIKVVRSGRVEGIPRCLRLNVGKDINKHT